MDTISIQLIIIIRNAIPRVRHVVNMGIIMKITATNVKITFIKKMERITAITHHQTTIIKMMAQVPISPVIPHVIPALVQLLVLYVYMITDTTQKMEMFLLMFAIQNKLRIVIII